MEHEIDGWIEQLSQCKQLPEPDVKKLCDKVRAHPQQQTLHRSSLTTFKDKGDLDGRIQCAAGQVSGHRLW
ncbi:hypothetical protein JVU11DRAFT_4342 [Chiua virens]|nr:hypothetical protein JVU11DRAFT_4342 [Chiua virens]